MRNAFAEAFYEAAKQDERLCMIVADISAAGAMDKMRAEMPSRFINTGVAEQAMIGIAAGMAMRGMKPFCYTIAPFALYRPLEFIRDDLCYQNLPVTVVGIGGGVAYSTLGSTHHAQEDIAVACAIPNLTVLAPCDPAETVEAVRWCLQNEAGPVYLRLGKAGEPNLTDGAEPFQFGKVRYLRRGEGTCVLGYGPILCGALDLAFPNGSVVSVHTIKPLDEDGIAEALSRHSQVIVLEEMAPQGGLADAVKRIAWERHATCAIESISLRDEFLHVYGTHYDVLESHGISL